MEPAQIIEWALAHGFRKTGPNAYSAVHGEREYQMLVRREVLCVQQMHQGRIVQNHAKCGYEHVHVDEHGMLQNAGLGEAFVREMWRGAPAPVWFTPEYTVHARDVMIPEWEARLAPRPGYRS